MNQLLSMSLIGPEAQILLFILLPFVIIMYVISSKNRKIRELEKEISYLKGLLSRERQN